jgi:two-component system sensor histidine kinase AlgZ
MLQPLLENAVYHGIEPSHEPGVIRIRLRAARRTAGRSRQSLRGESEARNISGNHMALANIRERLALYYDLEARLEAVRAPGDGRCEYRVHIVLPCRSDSA